MRAVAAFKKVALMVLGTAMQTYGEKLTDEQEVLSFAADILIDTYASRALCCGHASLVRRQSPRRRDLHVAAARVFVNDAAQRVEAAAKSRRSRPWPRATRCARCSRRSAES